LGEEHPKPAKGVKAMGELAFEGAFAAFDRPFPPNGNA